MSKLPKAKLENIVVQNLNDETLLYNLTSNQAFCLNRTAAFVWHHCDGRQSVAEISGALAKSSGQIVAQDVVWLAIEELKNSGLMEDVKTPFDDFKNIDRRTVIKRIGLASTVALPVIAGLIAPKAADAASGTTCGQICTNNAACTTAVCGNCIGRGTCGLGASPCTNLGGPCTSTGFCTSSGGKFPIYTCSIPGGLCFGPGSCTASSICIGSGTCQP